MGDEWARNTGGLGAGAWRAGSERGQADSQRGCGTGGFGMGTRCRRARRRVWGGRARLKGGAQSGAVLLHAALLPLASPGCLATHCPVALAPTHGTPRTQAHAGRPPHGDILDFVAKREHAVEAAAPLTDLHRGHLPPAAHTCSREDPPPPRAAASRGPANMPVPPFHRTPSPDSTVAQGSSGVTGCWRPITGARAPV